MSRACDASSSIVANPRQTRTMDVLPNLLLRAARRFSRPTLTHATLRAACTRTQTVARGARCIDPILDLPKPFEATLEDEETCFAAYISHARPQAAVIGEGRG
ncbi:hypothetical protein DFH11DRAFT_1874451 [Phellopilus nigrolimitatus]|nr:hypothetical protein DFH11DRAFT_1874451 [Phellopilus nigrolimitatus]